MTRRSWLVLVLLASLAGCANKPVYLKTEVSVSGGDKMGTYVVDVKIEDLTRQIEPTAPKLIVLEGERGQMTLTDKEYRTVVTALVERLKAHEGMKVNTTVVIEKKNVDVWSGSQTVVFKP